MKKVLVVDDTPTHLEALCKVVDQQGYRVIKATSGNQAIAIARSKQPDLILLDIVMDDLDGFGACRKILAFDECKHIPIVFVSTKHQRADRLWALKQGAQALVAKPFSEDDIKLQLTKYLG